VCGECANGCNIEIYHREGRIYRFQPRFNPAVNQYWMCDAGRQSYHLLQGEGRLTQPLVRGENAFLQTTWGDALRATAGRLLDLARGGTVGIVVSAQAPNEEIHLLGRIATALGARLAGIAWSPPDADHDDFLIKADKNPNTAGLVLQGLRPDGAVDELIAAAGQGTLSALVLHRTDLTRWREPGAVRAALERVPCLVVVDTDHRESAEYADTLLPIATYAESDGTFTNHAGRVQRFHAAVEPPGEARPGWRVLGDLLAAITGEAVPASAEAVFASLAGKAGPFAGLDYTALGGAGRTVSS
jgi:NADH-quinone oxidoreductase subunit G